MNPIIRIAGAALVVALLIGGALIVLRPTASVGPPASPSTSVAPSLDVAALTQGGPYFSPTLQVADIVARLNADDSLTAADRTQVIDEFLVIRDKETLSFSIDFYGGQLTQRETVDGRTIVGSFGSYAFPDAGTLVYTETIGGEEVVTQFELTREGDGFRLHRTTPAHGAADEFVTRVIFESGPFMPR